MLRRAEVGGITQRGCSGRCRPVSIRTQALDRPIKILRARSLTSGQRLGRRASRVTKYRVVNPVLPMRRQSLGARCCPSHRRVILLRIVPYPCPLRPPLRRSTEPRETSNKLRSRRTGTCNSAINPRLPSRTLRGSTDVLPIPIAPVYRVQLRKRLSVVSRQDPKGLPSALPRRISSRN